MNRILKIDVLILAIILAAEATFCELFGLSSLIQPVAPRKSLIRVKSTDPNSMTIFYLQKNKFLQRVKVENRKKKIIDFNSPMVMGTGNLFGDLPHWFFRNADYNFKINSDIFSIGREFPFAYFALCAVYAGTGYIINNKFESRTRIFINYRKKDKRPFSRTLVPTLISGYAVYKFTGLSEIVALRITHPVKTL
jgi:hypothetical protein